MNKIIVLSGKGGVGKTTVATNLAYKLSLRNYKVGLLDADIYKTNIAKMLGIENLSPRPKDNKIVPVKVSPNLEVVSMDIIAMDTNMSPDRKKLEKKGIIKCFIAQIVWNDLDYLIIDPPSGRGEIVSSTIKSINPKTALIVTTPQKIALMETEKVIEYARDMGLIAMGIVENMSGFVCPSCNTQQNIFKKDGAKKTALDMGVPFLGSMPLSPELVRSVDNGIPFIEMTVDSDIKKAFEEIVEFVRIFIEGR
ncbi:MAG: P-loop NTPase [Candidatus Methanofastidiosia archaeon]